MSTEKINSKSKNLRTTTILKISSKILFCFLIVLVYGCKDNDDYKYILDDLDINSKIVVIEVASKDLYSSNSKSPDSISKYTSLSGTGKARAGYGCEKNDFTVKVKRNNIFNWRIKIENNQEDKDYEVQLVRIEMKNVDNNVDFFGGQDLVPHTGNLDHIRGVVNYGTKDQIYEYNIKFTITHNNELRRYEIDPKLTMIN